MKMEMFEFHKNALLGRISNEPLCDEYKRLWSACGDNKEKLLSLALRQQSIPYFVTACHKGLGLSKDFIKREYKDLINGYVAKDVEGVEGYTYGLYVDWDYENDLEIKTDVTSIMWTIGANVVVPKTKCPTIYVSNRSKVHLICEGFNSVTIKLFDDSEVVIEDSDDNSEITVYRYSNKCVVDEGKFSFGEVKTFDKNLRL